MNPCRECRYWLNTDLGQGECRKGPPGLVVIPIQSGLGQMTMQPASMWPPTKADAWCWEFKDKESTDALQ